MNSSTLQLTVTDLNGNTAYAVTVHAVTSAGPGMDSDVVNFTTPSGPRKECSDSPVVKSPFKSVLINSTTILD